MELELKDLICILALNALEFLVFFMHRAYKKEISEYEKTQALKQNEIESQIAINKAREDYFLKLSNKINASTKETE